MELTKRAVAALHAAGDDPVEFQMHWLDFLIQWKGVYSKVQQAAKNTPQEVQWFGAVTRERKSDPLLRYLFEARNDGEHGLAASVTHSGPRSEWVALRDVSFVRVAVSPNGVERIVDEEGNDVARKVRNLPSESNLIEVTEYDGKRKVPPPDMHDGKPIEPKPLIAADLGLRWIEALVATAMAMNTP